MRGHYSTSQGMNSNEQTSSDPAIANIAVANLGLRPPAPLCNRLRLNLDHRPALVNIKRLPNLDSDSLFIAHPRSESRDVRSERGDFAVNSDRALRRGQLREQL